jgi:AcrR family transcriptional regulator
MLEAVGKQGYERASVRSVLDQTGLYRQAFYDNFEDKEDCYLQAYDAGTERVEGLMRLAAAGERTWLAKLRAGLIAGLEFLEAEPDVGRALVVEVHAAGPHALAKRAATMERAAAYLDRGRESGETSAPRIAPEAVAAGIHTVIHSRLAAREDGHFRQLLPEFIYVAVLPYFGAEAASEEMQAASP